MLRMGVCGGQVAEPWQAVLIGAIGGVACSFSGHFIRRFCVNRLGVHDTVSSARARRRVGEGKEEEEVEGGGRSGGEVGGWGG